MWWVGKERDTFQREYGRMRMGLGGGPYGVANYPKGT